MQFEDLLTYFATSPSVKLFRSPNAPYIVDFLHRQFKVANRISIPTSDLVSALNGYRDSLRETTPDALPERSEHYLISWSSGETRWLQRFLERDLNEPVYQLTPHIEDVFIFLDRASNKDLGFVGTESRLRLVIETLSDLVAGASPDPDVRLAYLREQRQKIDDEIDRILRDGVTSRYEPAVVRERFSTAVTLLKELLADFRAVEDRFRLIAREVQQRQVSGHESRGSILGYALDSEDVLKKDDQGVSFHEFYRFIASHERRERLQHVITELYRIEELSKQRDGLTTIRRMIPSLLAEAQKVMRTTQKLSATLRRLLDLRAASDRQRVALVIGEIKSLAMKVSHIAPSDHIGVTVDVGIDVMSPFSRTFWSPPANFALQDGPLREHVVDEDRRREAMRQLQSLYRLDWRSMREHVKKMTTDGTVTLRELTSAYPPTAGVIELLGYLQIARDDGHVVDPSRHEEIALKPTNGSKHTRRIRVPLVVFIATQGDTDASGRK